jgi:hypothetical protein
MTDSECQIREGHHEATSDHRHGKLNPKPSSWITRGLGGYITLMCLRTSRPCSNAHHL